MPEFLAFIGARQDELLEKVLEHLLLTGLSTALAVLTGIPLGLWLAKQPRMRQLIMSLISILQTIPSLAMLAFLLPFFGIGIVPALIALTLYALLPIVRNTIIAIESIADDVLEAAAALGFTSRQRLWQVELPLGMPIIIAGIRTAAVIGVGIATLAAFIGGGGLGDFIIRGLAVNSTGLILLGAIPAALLALLLDFSIQLFEKRPRHRQSSQSISRMRWFGIATAIALLLTTVFWLSRPGSGTVIRIGSKNFTEQFILGELMAQMLETHTDLIVERQFNLGSVVICHQALLSGEISLYPEYTGTAYRVILEQETILSAEQTYQYVRDNYSAQLALQWLEPFGFNDTYAVAMPRSLAAEHGITAISDLQPLAQQLTIGFAAEFYERADGYPGLIKHYDLQFGDTAEMDISLLYRAAGSGAVDVISGNSTDGRIAANDLIVLEDDRQFFPPYFAAPVLRQDVLIQHPEIGGVLNRLAGRINEQQMQAMNYAVDHGGQSVYAVAETFLQEQGLK